MKDRATERPIDLPLPLLRHQFRQTLLLHGLAVVQHAQAQEPNAFTGGVSVNAGTVTLGTGTSAGSGTLKFNGGNVTLGGAGQPTYANPLNIAANGTLTSAGGNNNIVSGPWTGTNTTLNVSIGSGTFTVAGNMSGFIGTVALGSSAGVFRFNGSSGSPNTIFNLGSGSANLLNRNGAIISLGAVSGGSGTFLTGASANDAASTYLVGGRNTNSTFNGTIADGGNALRTVSINKVGAGTWTLTGSNSYSGTTTVSDGALLVNGNQSAATNLVTVAAGGALGGLGTIGGPTTVDGVLAPGSNSIGRLTFVSDLTLGTNSVSVFELTLTPLTNDVARVLGNITYGGTLDVVNLGVEFLKAGDNFKLFDAAGLTLPNNVR